MAMDKGRYQPGDTIDGKYRIIQQLGAGGFATVYRAYSPQDRCELALKIMHEEADSVYIERFKREALIAAKIRHPNVVKIYGCGSVPDSNQPYIAMQLLEGHDLEEELKRNGPLSPHRMFVLIRPVLEALALGHSEGIVHKDLKPANLYLIHPGQPDEYVVVLDFGVARSEEYQKLTTTGQIAGTALYMAPEYIRHQIVTPAIDVYQMALIISELLTGRTAMQGESIGMLMKHCMGEIELAEFLKTGPAKSVFEEATCVDYKWRYKDCDAFGRALDGIADYFSSDVPLTGGSAQPVPTIDPKRETEIQNDRREDIENGKTVLLSVLPPAAPPELDPGVPNFADPQQNQGNPEPAQAPHDAPRSPDAVPAQKQSRRIERPAGLPGPDDIPESQKKTVALRNIDLPQKKGHVDIVIGIAVVIVLIGVILWLLGVF